MSEFLDELARTMAQPMPRRRALRAIGGALVTVATPGVLARSAGAAPAITSACQGCGVPHGAGCVLNQKCSTAVRGYTVCCTYPGYFGSFQNSNGGLCAQAGGNGLDPPGGLACCCPAGTTCGQPPGQVCVSQCKKCADGKCCDKPNKCVNGKCCPAIRTTHAPGTRGRGVACCPPGTVAVPGGAGLCCKRGDRHCCDAFDPRVSTGDDELPSLGLPKGRLCVNGKSRKA